MAGHTDRSDESGRTATGTGKGLYYFQAGSTRLATPGGGPAKTGGPAAGAPYLWFIARHSAFIGKRPFGRIAPPRTNRNRGDGMTEVLRAVLVDLVNLVKASRLPEESERTVLRCLGQL